MTMTSTGLERIRELWRELQQTRPTSNRYQELVALIRAETSAYRTRADTDQVKSRGPIARGPSTRFSSEDGAA